jgi:hypothetical protein
MVKGKSRPQTAMAVKTVVVSKIRFPYGSGGSIPPDRTKLKLSKFFINLLLTLYPQYDTVYGPYTRKDSRLHLILYKAGSKNNPKFTLNYPKALLEIKLNRILPNNYTTDHIDEDFTKDNNCNLQPLTRADNARKSMQQSNRQAKLSWYICPECGFWFSRADSRVRHNQLSLGKIGPFCSKHCAGAHNARIRYSFNLPPERAPLNKGK